MDIRNLPLIEGKYRVDRLIGEGAMGFVAQATDVGSDERVAIKFLHPGQRHQRVALQRFLRESQHVVGLDSQHICKVYEAGSLDSGMPYLVMEYLEGITLEQYLCTHGAPDQGTLIDWLLQVCMALAVAHAGGVVHRDIKPSNIFLVDLPDGSKLVKLIDFGVSKSAEFDVRLTRTSDLLGTPTYMAPEQILSSKSVDSRVDIWAIGVILYEIFAERRPFQARNIKELLISIIESPMPPLPDSLPRILAAVIMQCLQKQPEQRFRDVAVLSSALVPHAGDSVLARRRAQCVGQVLELARNRSDAAAGGSPASSPLPSGASSHDGRAGSELESRREYPEQAPPQARRTGIWNHWTMWLVLACACIVIGAMIAAVVTTLVDAGATPADDQGAYTLMVTPDGSDDMTHPSP